MNISRLIKPIGIIFAIFVKIQWLFILVDPNKKKKLRPKNHQNSF
jgi:hypothetical protein